MRRRDLLAGSAAVALSAPSIAQPSGTRVLSFIPRTGLDVLDPVWGTGSVTVTHGFYVFDTLYGVDEQLRPSPQMAQGHQVSDDGLTWTIRLRDGLRWHDGERVLARDCLASLRRWSERDVFGRLLARALDEWTAEDDRTLRIRLKHPFGALPDALAHPQASPAFMMPERLANTPASEQVREMVGSGPLRFLADEYRQGDRVAYARFDSYVPRDEPPQGTAGGKRVNFDRVHWSIIPDDSTAASAIQTGAVDWWEFANPDYVALMQKNERLRVEVSDNIGIELILRFNVTAPPFDNVKLRHVVLSAVDQNQFMPAVAGDVPGNWGTCYSLFACGLPGVNEVGKPAMTGPKDFAKLRDAVKASGYAGERVVILSAVDYSLTAGIGPVIADLLTKLGMNVDLQQMDFGTWIQRRNSRATTDKGGWSLFASQGTSAVTSNPGTNAFVTAEGSNGWIGWYDNPRVVALAAQWVSTTSESERFALIDGIQRMVFEDVPTIPLGLLFPRTVMQRDLVGFLPGTVAVPWNIKRS